MPAFRCASCSRRPRLPSWHSTSVSMRAGGCRWWPWKKDGGPTLSRCRLPRAGCGSSTSSRARRRPTTWRWRCGCPGTSMPTHWARRWPMWWSARRACARCSRRLRGYRGRWWCPPSTRISVGLSLMAPDGRTAGWVRPSTPRSVAHSTCRPRSPCGRGFSASPTMNTCW